MKLPGKRLECVLEKLSDRIHHRQTLSVSKLANSRTSSRDFRGFMNNGRGICYIVDQRDFIKNFYNLGSNDFLHPKMLFLLLAGPPERSLQRSAFLFFGNFLQGQ